MGKCGFGSRTMGLGSHPKIMSEFLTSSSAFTVPRSTKAQALAWLSCAKRSKEWAARSAWSRNLEKAANFGYNCRAHKFMGDTLLLVEDAEDDVLFMKR